MDATRDGRIDWVDYAKGFCIVMVVMMHATRGVEAQAGREGWMHTAVTFAEPLLMPMFFLISGLFLARVVDSDWRDYLDRKVLHFAYFYVLWVTIQFAFKSRGIAAEHGWEAVGYAYLKAAIEPFGSLWFIYLLPIFFVVTKLARDMSPLVVWLAAAMIEVAHVNTGWTVIDEFPRRFVYFYTGYILAPYIFEIALVVQKRKAAALVGLALWGFINGAMVATGAADLPFLSLALGFMGAGAVVAAAALIAEHNNNIFRPLRACGRHSIVIYLAFFLPMATACAGLPIAAAKAGIALDPGTLALLVTLCGVVGALAWYWAVRRTPLRFLFERPALLRLRPAPRRIMQPAE
jgi:uncharacterized membrane protein YcfT